MLSIWGTHLPYMVIFGTWQYRCLGSQQLKNYETMMHLTVCARMYLWVGSLYHSYPFSHSSYPWFAAMQPFPAVAAGYPIASSLPSPSNENYPLVIKHGNGKYTIYRWFSYWHPHFSRISNCQVWLPEGNQPRCRSAMDSSRHLQRPALISLLGLD